MIRRFGLVSALALAALPALADDRALIIGINDYSAVPGAPVLTGAVRDADAMTEMLTGEMGFAPDQITTLVDGAARHDAILSAIIDRLIGETAPGDRVLLHFSGLGTVLEDGGPSLVAADGDTVLGRIPLETLASIFSHIADRDVTVIIDAGFGAGAPGTRGLGDLIAAGPLTMGDDITLWSAADPAQGAWEDANGGALTQALHAAARTDETDADGDLAVTYGELQASMAPLMADWCAQSAACSASGIAVEAMLAGPVDAVLIRREAPEVAPPVDITPIIVDDGLSPGYRETLGLVTDLFSPNNAAGLHLAIHGGETLTIGDTVSFTATAARPGALLLLDLDPSGALVQVYPSRLSAEGATRIDAGQSLTIPSALGVSGAPLRIRVTEPAGQGLLLALFIEGDLSQLDPLMPAGLDGGPVAGGNQSLFEISQNLLRMEADPNNPVQWSATYLPYRIEP